MPIFSLFINQCGAGNTVKTKAHVDTVTNGWIAPNATEIVLSTQKMAIHDLNEQMCEAKYEHLWFSKRAEHLDKMITVYWISMRKFHCFMVDNHD